MKEMTRYQVIKSLLEGKITNETAAMALGLSRRQIQRLKKKVDRLGSLGIVHGNRGRLPPHAFSHEFRDRVVELVKTTYFDFNFSHLSEILEEQEGICVNRETLRRWLRPMGLGGKVRKLPPHRKRRKRSNKEGEKLFLDGSPHLWFEEETSTLILCTDDATGKPLYGLFQKEEDLDGCFRVCLEVFQKYGLPALFYLDRASQFTTTRHGGAHVTQSDREPTQFERAMEELGIGLIFAHSPQARGRGERINGTFQDRLVSELRLKGINHAQEATEYLNQHFIPKYHRRFGVEPADKAPAWRALSPKVDIRNVLCSRIQRTVNNDNTISINRQIIQLLETCNRLHFVKAKVQVNLWTDGSWHVFHPREGELPCVLVTETPCPREIHPVRNFRGPKVGKQNWSASQLRLHRQESKTTSFSDLGRY
jgi:transposase